MAFIVSWQSQTKSCRFTGRSFSSVSGRTCVGADTDLDGSRHRRLFLWPGAELCFTASPLPEESRTTLLEAQAILPGPLDGREAQGKRNHRVRPCCTQIKGLLKGIWCSEKHFCTLWSKETAKINTRLKFLVVTVAPFVAR